MTELCDERHKRVDERLDGHDKLFETQGKQLEDLTITSTRNSTQIENLCGKIGDLVQTTKWFIGIMVASFVSFFFYVVQSNL